MVGSRKRRTTPKFFTHGLLIAFGFVMLYPLLWMASSAFKPDELIFREPGLWSDNFTLQNFVEGWNALSQPFSRYLFNSAVIAIGSILGNLFACSLAAYAFARLDFRFKKPLFAIMLASMMLPLHVVIVPQYIFFSQVGLVNTPWPLILPKLLATDGFFVFLMVQFIRGLPTELDDAARIDGCGHWGVFWRIILPLSKPALATTAIFTFIWTWNDFFSQLIYLTRPENTTVPVALRQFVDSTGQTSWGYIFAMSMVSLGPVFGSFLAGQREK